MSIKYINLVWKLNIKSSQKIVLLALADYANENGTCFPSLDTLTAKCGLNRSTIIAHLNKLNKLGLISRKHQSDEKGYRRSSLYTLRLAQAGNCNNLSQSMKTQSEKNQRWNFKSQSLELPLSKVQNLDGNNINHHEPSLEPSNISHISEIEEIFNYWQLVMQHPQAKLDKNRQTRIKAALQLGYSSTQVKQAIDGCAKTPFNMGQNESNQRYDDIGLILKNSANIERFMSNANKSPEASDKNKLSYDEIIAGAI